MHCARYRERWEPVHLDYQNAIQLMSVTLRYSLILRFKINLKILNRASKTAKRKFATAWRSKSASTEGELMTELTSSV
jgi:hypothetical protein